MARTWNVYRPGGRLVYVAERTAPDSTHSSLNPTSRYAYRFFAGAEYSSAANSSVITSSRQDRRSVSDSEMLFDSTVPLSRTVS